MNDTTAHDDDTCPHCAHLWDNHDGMLTGRQACDVCGCLWQEPKPPPPPPEPPTLTDRVEDAIWDELDRQADGPGFAPYVDRDGVLDGSFDMHAVAAAVLAALQSRFVLVPKPESVGPETAPDLAEPQPAGETE